MHGINVVADQSLPNHPYWNCVYANAAVIQYLYLIAPYCTISVDYQCFIVYHSAK